MFHYDDPSILVTATSGAIMQPGRPFTFGFEVQFEKATVLCDLFMDMPLTVLHEDGSVEKPELPTGTDTLPFEMEIAEVVKSVETGIKSEKLDGALASEALTLCHRELESILAGKTVEI